MKKADIGLVRFLASKKTGYEMLRECLCLPDLICWNPSASELSSEVLDQIISHLSDSCEIRDLFELRLMTEFLLFREQVPAWAETWIRERTGVQAHLPEPAWEQAKAGRWRVVPVLLVRDRECRLRHFVTGAVPGGTDGPLWPDWAEHLMDEASKRALRNAAAAARQITPASSDHRLCCYPLTVPNGSVQFTGSSLGLPIGLGFLAAMTGEPLPKQMAATGAVGPDGDIGQVGGIGAKTDLSCQKNIKALLCPAENSVPLSATNSVTLLAVDTLRQAWMFSRLYTSDQARKLSLFSGMLRDARQFVRNIRAVPADWLKWAREHRDSWQVMAEILASPLLFSALTDRFEALTDRNEMELAEAVSELVGPGELDQVRQVAPLSAFRWCSLNLSLCNHRGKVSESEHRIQAAEALLPAARRADLGAVTTYFNHFFVSRHNRYVFQPALPRTLEETLSLLEKQYQHQCEFGCPAHLVLGKLYGSVSQNFAFCGPAFLRKAEAYSAKARKALGEDTVPEYRQEWLRQYNYLTYAYLDAGGDFAEKARESLFSYLGIGQWEDLWPRLPGLTQWEHALMARFLAEVPDDPRRAGYHQWCMAEKERIPEKEHPWQLWLFNMGRIAHSLGEDEAACDWFRQSLDLCLSEVFGASVRVMVLLPLSRLRHLRKADRTILSDVEKTVREAARKLNPAHFQELEAIPFDQVLDMAQERPGQIFPFNYR